jgi:hypothetical protein
VSTWSIASRKRSSTTREYIGAVTSVADLRAGRGEFASETDFYSYWRDYRFEISRAMEKRLQKHLGQQQTSNLQQKLL